MHPAPIDFTAHSKPCPACAHPLDEDRDGASCPRCGGLFSAREHFGKPALPPVFAPSSKSMPCPSCAREMSPVLCGAVAAFSCARCRALFFEGPRRRQIADPTIPVPIKRAISRPNMLAVVAEAAPVVGRGFMKLVAATAIVVVVVCVAWMVRFGL